MKALIIPPREADIADLSSAMYLQRHLAGPVDMVVLDDSYHIITLDKQRHIVVERTVEFAKHLEQRLGYKEPAVQPVKVNAAE